ncbi:MAG: YigZ family protein [Bacteroidota bacterium]
MIDVYQTIAAPSEGFYKDRGSRFLAFAYAVYSESDIKDCLEHLRKEHKKARHHCYAWRLGLDKNNYRANDDGEPSGTAGKPILGQIDSFGTTNLLIVVIRYFGGTKLGTSGLINAYKLAARDALEQAEIIQKTQDEIHRIVFDYSIMSEVMTLVKSNPHLEILVQDFQDTGMIEFAIRQQEAAAMIETLEALEGLEHQFLYLR